jgi:hypothetical protein
VREPIVEWQRVVLRDARRPKIAHETNTGAAISLCGRTPVVPVEEHPNQSACANLPPCQRCVQVRSAEERW